MKPSLNKMVDTWIEVSQAKDENRYELVLSGADVAKRITEGGLDLSIFSLVNINFLEISKTTLSILPDHVGNLLNLTQLVLHSNELQSLPQEIGKLSKLKNLDVSRNQLTNLPTELCLLTQIQHLNVSGNKLTQLPENLSHLSKLISLSVSQNSLQDFPIDCNSELVFLTEINGKANKITSIPSAISNLTSLRILDLEENQLTQIPGELGDCGKLKDMNLKGNSLKDRRLKKLVDQCHTKQVLEYIRAHCAKESSESSKKNKSKPKKGSKSKVRESEDDEQIQDQLEVLHLTDTTPVVIVSDSVKEVRPHILCCILKDVDLASGNNFKKFIALQSKLHDNECEKRNSATIATHDLDKIVGNLLYDACPPEEIKLIPLLAQKDITAHAFYGQLRKEAEALRKEKKRNTYSGIHKYLYLLDGKPLFPCVKIESSGLVISFPPITNSESSKITSETKHIFIEVTSSVSLNICKKVLDSILLAALQMELGKNEKEQNSDDAVRNHLTVEQVKIVDKIGQLRAVYPSRTDLQLDGIKIIRNFD